MIETIKDEQIQTLANVICRQINGSLKVAIPFEERVFNAIETADYLRVSRTYLLNTLRLREDFPKPISWSGEKRMSHPRWLARDLKKWINTKKTTA